MKAKNTLTLALITITLITLTTTTTTQPQANTPTTDNQWHTQIISTQGSRGGNGRLTPIAIDNQNNPHITYLAPQQQSQVTYTTKTQTTNWTTQTITYGNAFDIATDNQNNPHILHSGLKHTTKTQTTNYTTQTIDPTIPNGYATLTIDNQNNPHTAYTNGQTLKYATKTQTTNNWTTQTIETNTEIPYKISITTNQNNTPTIMYTNPSHYVDDITNITYTAVTVKIATIKNNNWTIQTVQLNNFTICKFGNMVLDSKGNPHFLGAQHRFQENTTHLISTILHVSWNGTTWNTQEVVKNIELENVGWLSLDTNDQPHIVYVQVTKYPNRELIYTTHNTTNWNNQTINTPNKPIGSCYLKLDTNNNPHITFTAYPPPELDLSHTAYIMYTTKNQQPTPTTTPTPKPIITPQTTLTPTITAQTNQTKTFAPKPTPTITQTQTALTPSPKPTNQNTTQTTQDYTTMGIITITAFGIVVTAFLYRKRTTRNNSD